jgi:hypothetical protein
MCRDIVKNKPKKCSDELLKELNEYNVLEFDIIKISTLGVLGITICCIVAILIIKKTLKMQTP